MTKAATLNLIKKAESYCVSHGLRFTEPRRAALEVVAAAKTPIGAYDVLAALEKTLKNPKPPTAYRALDFLREHGFIHRIESMNAYVLCGSDHHHDGSQFMICDQCGAVMETHLCTLPADFSQKTRAAGFRLSHWNIELHGTCGQCASA